MSILDERPATSPHLGRRRTDRAPLPEWLPAILLDEEPRDGDLIDASVAVPGDYWFEWHESDRTASWLRIMAVEPGADGTVLMLRGVQPMPVPAGRHVWILREAGAAVLARGSSGRVLHAWGESERTMEALLRGFESRRELLAWWREHDAASMADALVAWELLRAADDGVLAAAPAVGVVNQ